MPTKVENLVRDALTSPVRVTVGEVGAANEDVRQVWQAHEQRFQVPWIVLVIGQLQSDTYNVAILTSLKTPPNVAVHQFRSVAN